jgi:peptidyl-prolyl cis-trans isomerase D
MLRHFRSVFKSNQMPVMGVMLVVTLGMVAYLAPSGARNPAETVLARAYGRDILHRDAYLLAKNMSENAKLSGRGQFSPNMLLGYAVQSLIQAKVMEEMAQRHNVVVSDEETRIAVEGAVRRELQARPDLVAQFFGADGHLKPLPELEALDVFARMSGGARGYFRSKEAEVKEGLLQSKLRTQLALEVPLDSAWLEAEHRFQADKVDVELLTLPVDTKDVADPGDATLQTYLQASGTRFQEGPRRVIQVALADRASLDLKIDDATLKAAFEAKKGLYSRPADAEIRVRNIFFKSASPADLPALTKKAEALREELTKGRDFQKAAEELSDDPTAKVTGGDIASGFFTRGKFEPEFDLAAFGLEVGEISKPVRTKLGVHLIKLEDAKPKTLLTLDQVKDRVTADLQQIRFEQKAKERLEDLKKRAGGGDLSNGARALGLKLVTTAPLRRESIQIPDIEGGQALVGEAFSLKVGEVGTVTQLGNQFGLLRVQQELPVAVPPLKDIRARVLEAWQRDEARKRLMAKVQEGLKSGNLAALGTTRTETGKAPREIAGATDPLIRKALLEVPVGQLTPALWTPEGTLWAARITARTAGPAMDFEARRKLVDEIQSQVASKRFDAERRALLVEGQKHGGFSSLNGRLNGIYIDEKLLKSLTTVGSGSDE